MNMNIDNSTLLTLFTLLAGGSGIAGVIVAIATKKKSKADATHVIEQAAADLIRRYKEDNESLRLECVGLKKEITSLSCRVDESMDYHKELLERVNELEKENERLTTRIAELEKENERLNELAKGGDGR